MPIVSKKPGETLRTYGFRSASGRGAKPSTVMFRWRTASREERLIGERHAPRTPGSAAGTSSSWRYRRANCGRVYVSACASRRTASTCVTIEARVQGPQRLQAAGEERRAEQEHERQRDLRARQHQSPQRRQSLGRSRSQLLEPAVQVEPPGAAGRQHAGYQTAQDAERGREQKHSRVELHLHRRAVRARKEKREQKVARGPREQQGQRRAHPGQQQVFGEQLADQPRATATERQAEGELTVTMCRSREMEHGDVDAGSEKDDRDQDGEIRHRPGNALVQARQAVTAVDHDDALLVALTAGLDVVTERGVRHLTRALRRGAGLQAGQQSQPVVPGLFQPVRAVEDARLQTDGRPHVHWFVNLETGEASICHADHGDRRAVEGERRADDGWIAVEATHPVGVAENRHGRIGG